MVKGITRQVILVKSPDPKLFEEAIFIVKEEALAREGVSADQVIREARQAADAISAAAGQQSCSKTGCQQPYDSLISHSFTINPSDSIA